MATPLPPWAHSPFERDAVALATELRAARQPLGADALLARVRTDGAPTASDYRDILRDVLGMSYAAISERIIGLPGEEHDWQAPVAHAALELVDHRQRLAELHRADVAGERVPVPEEPTAVDARNALLAEMDGLDLDALEREAREDIAVAEGATAGPWVIDIEPEWMSEDGCAGISSPHAEERIVETDSGFYGPSRADAALIARARTARAERAGQALALCSALREQAARIAALEVELAVERQDRAATDHIEDFDRTEP